MPQDMTTDLRSAIKPALVAAIREMRRNAVDGTFRMTDTAPTVRVEWVCGEMSTSMERDALWFAKRALETAGLGAASLGSSIIVRAL